MSKGVLVKQNPLAASIKSLSPVPMRDEEAEEAARNLADFFELLIEIDQEQRGKPLDNGLVQ